MYGEKKCILCAVRRRDGSDQCQRCGVIETARKHKDKIGKVYAGRNGIIGALTEDLIDTGKDSAPSYRAPQATTPSGAFGSCRYKLKGLRGKPCTIRASDRSVQGA